MEKINKNQIDVDIMVAKKEHEVHAEPICRLIEEAAAARGTGIAKRSVDYIKSKINEGKAVIAFGPDDQLAGFCYIETWEHGKYVANSGLIVAPEFRGIGHSMRIKKAVFDLSRKKFPDAKIFGITTSPAVLKINNRLGYRPVGFLELTQDQAFWDGCKSCRNFDILMRTKRNFCLFTGMLYDPQENVVKNVMEIEDEERKSSTGI
ncbi:MAG: GNAT family N-acetyltransferase [Calditrichaceae bacterium]